MDPASSADSSAGTAFRDPFTNALSLTISMPMLEYPPVDVSRFFQDPFGMEIYGQEEVDLTIGNNDAPLDFTMDESHLISDMLLNMEKVSEDLSIHHLAHPEQHRRQLEHRPDTPENVPQDLQVLGLRQQQQFMGHGYLPMSEQGLLCGSLPRPQGFNPMYQAVFTQLSPSSAPLSSPCSPPHMLGSPDMRLIQLEFQKIRSLMHPNLSSPEPSPSPTSDQGFFEVTDVDLRYDTRLGDDLHLASTLENMDVSSRMSGSTPDFFPRTPSSPKTCTRIRKKASRLDQVPLTSPLFVTTPPTLAPPLKYQFSSLSDSEDQEERADPPKRKRVRKPKKPVKYRSPPPKLSCTHSGCSITCSSYPSLLRHSETHRWRGLYAPVRCEACQSALSNEFSVQRHILRSQPTSRCRRMRVYSVMKSETEVENTLRFYPKRPHGKKTIPIDLEYARSRY